MEQGTFRARPSDAVILPGNVPRPDHWPDWELLSFGQPHFLGEWRKWQADPGGYSPPPKPET